MKNYFLDTNICVEFLRDKNKSLKDKLLSYQLEFIKIPAVVAAELLHGANKSRERYKSLNQVQNFLSHYDIISFGLSAAKIYGEIKAKLEAEGNIIGSNDLLIAATALSRNGILVTNNTREFSRIDGLLLEDWT